MFDQKESKWFSRLIFEFCFHVPILHFFLFVNHCTCVLDVTRAVWFYILFCFIESRDIICSYSKVINVYTFLILVEVGMMLFTGIRIAAIITTLYIYIYIYIYIHNIMSM